MTGILYEGGALAPANLQYSYDLAGRRVGVSGSLASTQLPTAVSSAVYNANNQLTQWGSTGMTYDLNGNTLNDGTNTYTWDARNRLVSADSNAASFSYDPLGRRVGKTLLAGSTSFLYDGVNPVQELNGSTPTANLLTGGLDERFVRTTSTETDNYLTDALGSTIALTGTTGSLQTEYSYGPFGNMSVTGSTTNSYNYTGRETDGLGINYYRARYYNPAIGRFLSEDPAGFAGSGTDLYAYAGDDPIDFIDPFGMDKKKECEDKLADINNLVDATRTDANPSGFKGLAQRFRQMMKGNAAYRDPGHLEQIYDRQQELKKALQDYKDTGCGDPPSSAVNYADQPIASPYPQGSSFSSTVETGAIIVGGIVVIGGTVLLCPECIVAAPVLAF